MLAGCKQDPVGTVRAYVYAATASPRMPLAWARAALGSLYGSTVASAPEEPRADSQRGRESSPSGAQRVLGTEAGWQH